MFDYLLIPAITVFVYMTLVFILALIIKDNTIVHVFRGLGIILLVTVSLWPFDTMDLKKYMANLLILAWGLGLSYHIFQRNRGKGEDFRYANRRRIWRFFILRSFLQVFVLQGFLLLIIAWPVLHINYNKEMAFGFIDIAGLFIFLTGFYFEAMGDFQLRKFNRDPENSGRIITSGLWKYTRHPDYFGEALLWWGIWLMAVPVVDGIYTIASPIIITLLLRYVSGVPMREKKYEGRADWEEYKLKTPAFFPFK